MPISVHSLIHVIFAALCLLMAGAHLLQWLTTRERMLAWLVLAFVAWAALFAGVGAGGSGANGAFGPTWPWVLIGILSNVLFVLVPLFAWELGGRPVVGWRKVAIVALALLVVVRGVEQFGILVFDRSTPFEGLDDSELWTGALGIVVGVCVAGIWGWELWAMRSTAPVRIAGIVLIASAAGIMIREVLGVVGVIPHETNYFAFTALPFIGLASLLTAQRYAEATRGPSSIGNGIAGYRIVRRLGGGGMGELFLAARVGPSGFVRHVAIKRILAKNGSPADHVSIERFLAEARLAAQLDHPNIVAVHDLGRLEDGWFIAMEYLPGASLAQVRDHTRALQVSVPASVLIAVGEQACRGLGAAHRAGIVHRDISPHNVMVTFEGGVKIVDFGIAKAAGDLQARSPSADAAFLVADAGDVTGTGLVLGKTAYLAPEQLLGDPATISSDLFSLGVVLYEIACGRKPYPSHVPRGLPVFQPAPQITEQRAEIPELLAGAIHRAIALDPAQRFASADEMADAIARAGAPMGGRDLGAWMRRLLPDDYENARVTGSGSSDITQVPRPDQDAIATTVAVPARDRDRGDANR